jgi:hypothetical protein
MNEPRLPRLMAKANSVEVRVVGTGQSFDRTFKKDTTPWFDTWPRATSWPSTYHERQLLMASATSRPMTRRRIIRNRVIAIGALLLYCGSAFLHLGGATSDNPLKIAVASVSFASVGLVVWFCSFDVLADPETRSGPLGWCVAGCLAIVVWLSWTRPAGHAAIGIFLLLLLQRPTLDHSLFCALARMS